jgi:hypothetical protein
MQSIERISRELSSVSASKLRAYAEGDRVLIMVQNAPAELRKLADELEKIEIKEIQAMIAYRNPTPRRQLKAQKPKKLLPGKVAKAKEA